MQIKLTGFEVFTAAMVGCRRKIESLGHSKTQTKDPNWGWHSDIEGACAEMATAKALDIYWNHSVNTFKDPDVGNLQVRCTDLEHGCLIIRPDDDPRAKFVLVVGAVPNYRICGWIWGGYAKKEAWLKNPNGRGEAWFVPQGDLYRMETIRDV